MLKSAKEGCHGGVLGVLMQGHTFGRAPGREAACRGAKVEVLRPHRGRERGARQRERAGTKERERDPGTYGGEEVCRRASDARSAGVPNSGGDQGVRAMPGGMGGGRRVRRAARIDPAEESSTLMTSLQLDLTHCRLCRAHDELVVDF